LGEPLGRIGFRLFRLACAERRGGKGNQNNDRSQRAHYRLPNAWRGLKDIR
jgi:hypothetical protein